MTVISAEPVSFLPYFQKLWASRAMVLTLARRDLKVKYAQTLLGLLWAVIQPLTGLLIFTLFFDKLINIDTGSIPYPLFAFSGMVSWFFFSHIVHSAGTSLVEAQDLMKKVYFPKLIIPLAKVLAGMVELAISLSLLFVLMLVLGKLPDWPILLLPLFVLFNISVGLSIALWLSALTIRYRDFHHIIPYLVNFGIWLTPVFYPGTLIPSAYDWFLFLNPMAATIAGFRWSLIGDTFPEASYLMSVIPVSFLLVTGLLYFRKIESEISDYI